MKTVCEKLIGIVLIISAMTMQSIAVADKVLQWDLRDYDNNGSTSAFTFVAPPDYPDGTTGSEGGIRFGDQSLQIDPVTGLPYEPPLAKETRCLLTDQELQDIFASGPFETVYFSDFGSPCNPLFFDTGGPTDVREFTFGFLFSSAPFFPAIAATKANPTDLVGDTGDVSGDITIDKDGNRTMSFTRLDTAGVFGTTLFILPPTTNPPGASDPDDPSTIREVDPSTVVIQEFVPLGGTQFGVAAQWLSKIYEEGSSFNDNVARFRMEGVMTVEDDRPVIFLNGANPASVPPNGSYVDDGAVCQDVVDGEITSTSSAPASFTTIPEDPDVADVGDAGNSFTVTYNCTDSASNSADPVVRTVNVEEDTTPPEITLLAGEPEQGRSDAADGSSVDILVGKTYIDAGATCLDNADGEIPLGSTGSPEFVFAPTTVDTSTASDGNEIIFTCTDTSANTATATRLVNVLADEIKPVLTLGGLPELTVSVGSDFTVNEPPTTCTDTNPIDTDPIDISQNVQFSPTTVDTSSPGSVEITYTCEDAAGNPADPVTQTVNVVGGQSFNVISMTISDIDGDGLAGCFKFGSLDPATCDLANAFSSDGSVTGLGEGNATLPGGGTDLDEEGNPIGIKFGVFQPTKAISPGFLFTGFPFEPLTFDPPSEDAFPPQGSVLISGDTASLIIDSFPFGGLYSSNKPNAFFLDPDDGTLSAVITADNNDDDGTTRTFNYLMTWTHVITAEEDPTNQFTNFNAFWRLEGKLTADSNPSSLNAAPIIEQVAAIQSGEITRIIVSTVNFVDIVAEVSDPDGDDITFDWSATDSEIVPIDGFTNETLVFDPAELAPGLYTARLLVTDDDPDDPKSANAELIIDVVSEAPELGPGDSDGDGIPDDQEGFGDSDNDALPNFQDAIDGQVDPSRNRLDFSVPEFGDITSDKGRLSLGTTAFSSGQSSFIITEDDVSDHAGSGGTPVDNGQDRLNRVNGLGHSGGGIHDWTVSGLNVGESVCVILPQKSALPTLPIYRRYTRENGWVDFVSGVDTLASTSRIGGVCPEDPDAYDASTGLVEGDDCVRVCITDGGANDLDTARNGSVSDPASAAGNGSVFISDSIGSGCSLINVGTSSASSMRLDWLLLFLFLVVLRVYQKRYSNMRSF